MNLLFLVLSFIFLGCIHASSDEMFPWSEDFQKVQIEGNVAINGIYDPSLEYNEDGSVGWLAYTAV